MPSIGDLANDVARGLYEYRIAVAILSIVIVVAAALVAWRLGWLAAARRHPGRAATVMGIALLIALPAGWYLGSPIFIRTSLVEAPPVVAESPAPAPSVIPSAPAPSVAPSVLPTAPPTLAPTPTPTFQPATLASGSFEGTDDFHFGRGTASIIEVEPGRFHLRFEDFSVRNGPDLYVYLSPDPDGYADDALELGTLKATDGSFGYDLPAGTDPTRFRSAIIWCKQFSHLFATAAFRET